MKVLPPLRGLCASVRDLLVLTFSGMVSRGAAEGAEKKERMGNRKGQGLSAKLRSPRLPHSPLRALRAFAVKSLKGIGSRKEFV